MPKADWFYGNPGSNKYNISEHVRHSLWFNGYRSVWFECTRHQSPYEGKLFWHDQQMELVWEPRQYLLLKLPQYDEYVVHGLSMVLGFKPQFRYRDDAGRTAVEWRRVDLKARQEELERAGAADLEVLKPR